MSIFNFFGDGSHKVFDYKPIYYDKEAEERRRYFGKVDGRDKNEKGEYVPGTYLKGAFRDGNYEMTRAHNTRIHTIIGIITLLLLCGILYMIARFYSML